MYRFPKDLYADIRIEERYDIYMGKKNGEVDSDGTMEEAGAMIRVFDGKMWYTCTTNNLDEIQAELDNLAMLAEPDPGIWEHPLVKRLEVHKDRVLRFEGEKDLRKVSREQWLQLVDSYVETCVDENIPEIQTWYVNVGAFYIKKSFYSGKGAEIVQDMQNCWLSVGYDFTVDGITTYGGKSYYKFCMEELLAHEQEILAERSRYLDFVKNAVPVEPGDYVCVLSPGTTGLFTHESFGHKSEADFMLSDKTLQEEWVIGKKVGSDLVSICDRGDLLNHGYVPYDDEGTKTKISWLMKDGVLTGRLHDAKSAAILGEELTGNERAQNYLCTPVVRMTNTFMAAGKDEPGEIIKEIKDGIYIYNVDYGTGQATFTLKPEIAYRIRDGKICEPIRINVVTGSVFRTLFDIDAVGNDFQVFDTCTCGKAGQSVDVACGGPTIRVKKLTVN